MSRSYVGGFRFSGGYEDVFAEDGGYLYVCAEPDGWAHLLHACSYLPVGELDEDGEMAEWMSEHTSCDLGYALGLDPAPYPVARQVVNDVAAATAAVEAARTGEDAGELYRLLEVPAGEWSAA